MEKPILFNTEMVKAVLEGRKTQTRRVLKKQPDLSILKDPSTELEFRECPTLGFTHVPSEWGLYVKDNIFSAVPIYGYKCPYGKKGDLLWVRETWQEIENTIKYKADLYNDTNDYLSIKWKPSIYMPKKYCRLWLEVIDVRVERLQDISEKDAMLEGIKYFGNEITDFANLWNSINEKRGYGWSANPWVWVVKFKVFLFQKYDFFILKDR